VCEYVISQKLSYINSKPHCVLYVFLCIHMVICRATQNFSYGIPISCDCIHFPECMHYIVLFYLQVYGLYCSGCMVLCSEELAGLHLTITMRQLPVEKVWRMTGNPLLLAMK